MADNEKKIDRLVKRSKWSKLEKMLEKGDPDDRVSIAAAFGTVKDEQPINYLILMLKDPDAKVQLQAVKSLGNLAVERTKVHLQNMLPDVPEENTELHSAIRDSIGKINEATELERKYG